MEALLITLCHWLRGRDFKSKWVNRLLNKTTCSALLGLVVGLFAADPILGLGVGVLYRLAIMPGWGMYFTAMTSDPMAFIRDDRGHRSIASEVRIIDKLADRIFRHFSSCKVASMREELAKQIIDKINKNSREEIPYQRYMRRWTKDWGVIAMCLRGLLFYPIFLFISFYTGNFIPALGGLVVCSTFGLMYWTIAPFYELHEARVARVINKNVINWPMNIVDLWIGLNLAIAMVA